MKLQFSASSTYSLPTVISSHGWVQLAPFSRGENGDSFTYCLELKTGPVVAFSVTPAENGALLSSNGRLDDDALAELSAKVQWMLGLHQDLSEFYAAARGEPKLAHVEGKAQGRLLRSATVFEDVVKTILTTNTTWSGTIRMVQGLVDHFGAPLPDDPARRAFPTPARLAQADGEVLRKTVKLGYRAPYVLELAQRTAAGELDLEAWKTAVIPTADLRKQLLALKGVGPYAAASLLMLLGHYDFVPVDSWAFKLVSYEWHGSEPIGQKEVEAAFADWGQWKGLAYWFWDWRYTQENQGG
ncbi:MAG: DNA-3-methyladenine glycosylase 2 family protein [Ardenticatenaceae bacterium]|nr:DNA-3-methyladenine glycosylase 2 family protein [Ardenticatenaceae bacterium]MCB8988436.1 DNA-3-methyladenine glycosylase 2 family protein [Ardenticatenaceae bacterium]